MRRSVLFTVILLLLVRAGARAQQDMIVEHYAVEDGLTSNTVYMSLKDSDGFLWFATWHGLCSFDGSRFTSFVTRHNKLSDIPPRKIAKMVEDGKGYIWIRDTDNHLYLFDRKKETFRYIFNELKEHSNNVQVIKIQRTGNGNVIILTRDKCLYEATTDDDGCPRIARLFDSTGHIDNTTMRLTGNVLGETGDRLYWMDKHFNICVVEKKSGRQVLTSIPRGTRFTCCYDSGHYLCLGTTDGDVYVIDTDTWKTERHAGNGIHTPVTAAVPLDGNLYVSTAGGLFVYGKNGDAKRLSADMSDAVMPYVDHYGKIWMNKGRTRLMSYNPGDGTTATFTMAADSINDFIVYRDAGANGLFILTLNGDVWRYDHKTGAMSDISGQTGLTPLTDKLHFRDLYLDVNGQLWLSSTTSGVFKISFPRRSFSYLFPDIFSHSGRETDNTGVRSIFQTRNGDLWVGTRGGELYCMDIRTGEILHRFSGDIGNVYHIMEDRSGNLWLSTKGAGLIKATPDAMSPQGMKMTRYTHDTADRYSISNNRVYYTFQDAKGRIWVCTFGGGLNLMKEKNGQVCFISKLNELNNYPEYDLYVNVRSITEDNDGRIWVGTTDGLMSFDGDFDKAGDIAFETYRDENSGTITDNDIFTLFKDSYGNIWLGTFGGGLHKIEGYDGQGHRPLLRSYGFTSFSAGDVVASIAEDSQHCLWICSESRLSSLQLGSDYVVSYDRFSGFPVVHIEDNSSLFTRDGRILIGCREGLVAFNPMQVRKENSLQYSTFIVDIKVQNRGLADFDPPIYNGSARYAEQIELNHDRNMFTIEFSTLTFTDQERVCYTYILDGYEDRWHDNGINRFASYANVPPGRYVFRVKPTDGTSPECSITIIIRPPWWATWWAYLIYIIIGCALLYGILRLILYTMRIRNEVYINDRLAELKIRFFTNVSHELRTPLTLIKGPIEELKNSERLSDTGKEYLSLIDRNASKMLRLVNQILDFRKVQNGKIKMHVSYIGLRRMLEAFRAEYRVMADERDIAFRLEMPDEDVMMWCDADKIRVVIGNLISNAFKFTPAGGTICVSADTDERRNTVHIRVEDNGIAIPKNQLEVIFERFSQVDADAAAAATAGTGIGLSLSRELVVMHGGRIWAENLPGDKGVAFIIEIPADKEHFAEDVDICINDVGAGQQLIDDTAGDNGDDDSAGKKPDTQLSTILLVEDNVDVCRMISLQLRGQYNVYTAHNGKEGLEQIYRYRPDIVITDLMMPDMDGMELLRRVRKDFNISHTPIIVLTAKLDDEDMMAAVSGGANAYITKPFSSDYLSARIKQLVEEQRIFQRKMALLSKKERNDETVIDEYKQHLVKKDLMFVEQIHEIIEKNLNSDDFNINTIAETIGLSRSAFFKKLKSLTGFAPVDLVREIRLAKAASMIETSDDSITAIAYAVGFHDVGYFGKCFRRKFGKTPKDYRAAFRKG